MGGRSPYYISWNNGQIGTTINGLLPNTYQAEITDSDGNVAIIECEVGYDSLYPSTTPTLTPTPTPSTTPIPTICLANPRPHPYANTTLTYNGLDVNGNYTWVGSGLTMFYHTTNNRWQVTPWSPGSIINNTSPNQIPIGTWTELGNPEITIWSVFVGVCSITLPLSLTYFKTNQTSPGANDGSVNLIGIDGTPPYQYRISGVPPYPTYQNGGLFNGLSSGMYTGR